MKAYRFSKSSILLNLVSLLLLLSSCVSVPQASVELSGELTQMTIRSRQAHLKLLDEYTALRKAQVEKFMNEEWIPTFMGNFVRESGIIKNIQSARTDSDKGTEILEFSQAALPVITERRNAMMTVVMEMDALVRKRLEDHYQEMLNLNQALTAHLGSAAKLVETRQQLQKQLRINPDELIPIDQANRVMDKLLRTATRAEEIPGILNEFKEILNQVKDGKDK